MPDEPKCPTCHSNISSDPTKRTQGSMGTDSEGKPIPRWTDDPVLTTPGFSGAAFTGLTRPGRVHIEELQEDRKQLEADLKIEPVTDFSAIEAHGFHVRQTHIIELRESTEKILDAVGSTLADYFKLDSEGNEVTPGPNDSVKTDWTDVSRGLPYLNKSNTEKKEFTRPISGNTPSPTIPDNVRIRAIHIEDLRHYILTKLYPVIYCESYFSSFTLYKQALSKRGKESKQYFSELKDLGDYKSEAVTVNNMDECLIAQKGVSHLFSGQQSSRDFTGTPMYSYCESKDLSVAYWKGYIKNRYGEGSADYWIEDQIAFEPLLPFFRVVPPIGKGGGGSPNSGMVVEFNKVTTSFTFEGITGLAIDTSGDDYLMYTTEFFYSRAGGNFDAWNHPYYFDSGHTCNYIAKYTFPRKRVLGVSNGSVSQIFDAQSAGIKCPVAENSATVTVDTEPWTRVDNFNKSTPSSRHYTLAYSSGLVTFGNGTKGKIPTSNATISLDVTLAGGGIWKYDSIVVPKVNRTIYFGLQARNGKLWYQQVDEAFRAAYIATSLVHTDFTEVEHQVHGLSGALENSSWWAETPCLVQGQSTLLTQFNWRGTQDSGMFISGFNPQPNVLSDNPYNFSFTFEPGTTHNAQIGVWALEKYSGVSARNQSVFIDSLSEAVIYTFEYSHWNGTTVIRVVVDASSSTLYFTIPSSGNAMTDRVLLQVGDETDGEDTWNTYPVYDGPPLPGNEWRGIPMGTHKSGHTWSHRTTPPEFHIVTTEHGYEEGYWTYGKYARWGHDFFEYGDDSSIRPSTRVPIKFVWKETDDTKNEPGLIALGGQPWLIPNTVVEAAFIQ